MHVISMKKLKQFWLNHPNAEVSLRYWYKLTIQHRIFRQNRIKIHE